MKTTSTLLSTPFLLALLATASPTTTTPATAAGNSASSPSSSAIFVNGTTTTALPLLAAQGDDPIPPGPGQHLRCDTTNKSPGVANIAIAAKWFRDQDANKLCGTNGGNENMHHESGVRIWVGGRAGNARCRKVADLLAELAPACTQLIDGDIRAGGTIWLNSESDGTYVFVTQ